MSVRGDELPPSFWACTIRRRWPPEPDGRGRVQNLDNCIGKTSNSVPKGSRLCRAAPKAGSQATKGARWMPWRQGPRKDAVGGDRTGEVPNNLRSGCLRMGEPGAGHTASSRAESIGAGRSAGELKHLSTRRKRNQPRFPEEWRGEREEPKPGARERRGALQRG